MTLTAALCAALATPADLEPFWSLLASDDSAEITRIGACLLLYGLCPADPAVRHLETDIPMVAHAALDAGADRDNLIAVMRATVSDRATVAGYMNFREPARRLAAWAALRRADDPNADRPAEWTAAAERLAAWADGVAP